MILQKAQKAKTAIYAKFGFDVLFFVAGKHLIKYPNKKI